MRLEAKANEETRESRERSGLLTVTITALAACDVVPLSFWGSGGAEAVTKHSVRGATLFMWSVVLRA